MKVIANSLGVRGGCLGPLLYPLQKQVVLFSPGGGGERTEAGTGMLPPYGQQLMYSAENIA